MSERRLTNLLMGVIAILLLAHLIRPLLEPTTAFAQAEKAAPETVAVTGSGTTAWVLKNNQIYYVRWDNQFKKVQIDGPEALDQDIQDDTAPVYLTGVGNSAWVLKGNYLYYIKAVVDNNFVTLEIERPEELPE